MANELKSARPPPGNRPPSQESRQQHQGSLAHFEVNPQSFNHHERMQYVKELIKKILPPPAVDALRGLRDSLPSKDSPSRESAANTEKKASLNFEEIYSSNGFDGTESLSGGGSTLFQTRLIRIEIPLLLRELGVKTLLDVPCGDWNWMQHVTLDGVQYTGGDVVQSIVDENKKKYADATHQFERLNIVTGPLLQADLILCRDCLVHLSFADGLKALEQFRASGARWLLTTTFTDRGENSDLYDGHIWRPLNLEKSPYNMPKAERYINEGCTEGDGLFGDKCLALWRIG
jgi:hypothetical protein